MAERNETIEDMYHLLQSLETITEGFRQIDCGLREVQAGVTNLRICLSEIEDIAAREYDDRVEEELKKVEILDPSSQRKLRRVPKARTSLRGGSGSACCGGNRMSAGRQSSSGGAGPRAGEKSGTGNQSSCAKKSGSGGQALGPFELGGEPIYKKPDLNVSGPKSSGNRK